MTNSSTRITRDDVLDLCETIHASGPLPVFGARVLGLFLCVRLTLTYLRHNLPQELLAELYCVSQATVSRVISAYTPLITQALQTSVPTVEDLDPTTQLIIDGTHIGDKGYIGLGMITPKRKPPNLPLHPDDKTYNKTVNQIRYKIERVIANIKTWRVLHTGYRRPLQTFPETITAILGIIFTYTP